VECRADVSLDDPDGALNVAGGILAELRPALRSEVALSVEEFLTNRSVPIGDMSFYV
jgi:hypothetical protein